MARPRLRELGGAAAGVEVVARARACRHEAWVAWPDGGAGLAGLEDVSCTSADEVSRGDEARAGVWLGRRGRFVLLDRAVIVRPVHLDLAILAVQARRDQALIKQRAKPHHIALLEVNGVRPSHTIEEGGE